MTVGILGLQGCCAPHERAFADLGVATRRVLYPADLDGVQGLLLPGGESSTMLRNATPGLWERLGSFATTRPVWGVCAGCILVARHVFQPVQASLDLLNLDVVRNAYGAQNESFVARLPVALPGGGEYDCVFIRAPRISRVGAGLTVLAQHGADPVMVTSERHLVTTFHPELTPNRAFHRYFADRVAAAGA